MKGDLLTIARDVNEKYHCPMMDLNFIESNSPQSIRRLGSRPRFSLRSVAVSRPRVSKTVIFICVDLGGSNSIFVAGLKGSIQAQVARPRKGR
ncbi:MAG: hypothetical protein AAB209_12110, partial [Bacteroidota bacterium]